MPPVRRFLLYAPVLAALALPAGAQERSTAAPTAFAGPTIVAGMAGVRLAAPSDELLLPQPDRRRRNRANVALMVVGGAGIIVGSVIDDDDASTIVIVAGSVVLLYGLYRYLQQ